MPRIRLAYWHGSNKPGDEVDVSDDDLRDLQRDGRVAEVLEPAHAEAEPAPEPQPEPGPEAVDAAQPDGAASPGRKRR
ncbi:hypothetical protein ACGF3K_14590 [Streptomyces sp. NPDC047980]|uniref:hypothetical protein n=1 Tax=Streptomyces sp. NPDC047980 TaxID=3365494 RepID=UPI00371BBCC6